MLEWTQTGGHMLKHIAGRRYTRGGEELKILDVIALGELLIDFTEVGQSEQGNDLFEACPGGAPCNVLAILNKLGKKTAFIGKVGPDQFGVALRKLLDEMGIGTSHLITDDKVNTTLAFVHTGPGGERDFSFYRNPGADMQLTADEIDPAFIETARAFHFGSLSMTHDGVRKATKKAVQAARDSGLLISFDPNLRPPLWDDLEAAKEQIRYGLENCDMVKIADNEVEFMTGKTDLDAGARELVNEFNVPLMFLTMGPNGSCAYYKGEKVTQSGFSVPSIESTGAGDTFCGSALNFVLETGIDNLTTERLQEILTYANAAAAIVTTRKGAIRAMPETPEVHRLMKHI